MTDYRPSTERALKEITAALDSLATVDAPAPTLAEDLRHIAENSPVWTIQNVCDNLLHAASRAEQIEQERDHFFREVENVRNWKEQLLNERDEARAEVERLTDVTEDYARRATAALTERDRIASGRYITYAEVDGKPVQKGAESNAESLDPADVPAGEAWLVECRGERRTAVKDRGGVEPWNTVSADDGYLLTAANEDVTLVSRMVPAPRVITNHDDLERLRTGSIILDGAGRPCKKNSPGLLSRSDLALAIITTEQCLAHGPVTVLWEPGA